MFLVILLSIFNSITAEANPLLPIIASSGCEIALSKSESLKEIFQGRNPQSWSALHPNLTEFLATQENIVTEFLRSVTNNGLVVSDAIERAYALRVQVSKDMLRFSESYFKGKATAAANLLKSRAYALDLEDLPQGWTKLTPEDCRRFAAHVRQNARIEGLSQGQTLTISLLETLALHQNEPVTFSHKAAISALQGILAPVQQALTIVLIASHIRDVKNLPVDVDGIISQRVPYDLQDKVRSLLFNNEDTSEGAASHQNIHPEWQAFASLFPNDPNSVAAKYPDFWARLSQLTGELGEILPDLSRTHLPRNEYPVEHRRAINQLLRRYNQHNINTVKQLQKFLWEAQNLNIDPVIQRQLSDEIERLTKLQIPEEWFSASRERLAAIYRSFKQQSQQFQLDHMIKDNIDINSNFFKAIFSDDNAKKRANYAIHRTLGGTRGVLGEILVAAKFTQRMRRQVQIKSLIPEKHIHHFQKALIEITDSGITEDWSGLGEVDLILDGIDDPKWIEVKTRLLPYRRGAIEREPDILNNMLTQLCRLARLQALLRDPRAYGIDVDPLIATATNTVAINFPIGISEEMAQLILRRLDDTAKETHTRFEVLGPRVPDDIFSEQVP